MYTLRILVLLAAAAIWTVWLAPARASDPELRTRASAIRARPALMIVRVSQPPETTAQPELELVEPRGLTYPPFDANGRAPLPEDGRVPSLGSDYELVRQYTIPGAPEARYLVYQLNLSDPSSIRNWRAFQRAIRAERREALAEIRNEQEWQRRNWHLHTANQLAVREGVLQLQERDYRGAVLTLTRAAEFDHGDAASRVLLALARVSLGHDTDAARAVRRALELQPNLVTMQLGLEQCFAMEHEFGQQVDGLAARIDQKPAVPADQYLLLGFLEFQRGRIDAAHWAFRQAARGKSSDELVRRYLELTKPAETIVRWE